MRATTRVLALAAALAVAAPVGSSLTAGDASADMSDGGTFLPFAQVLRLCDYSKVDWVGPTGYARPQAVIRSDGSTVSADLQIATAIPNIRYDVRLIQAPRPSSSPCWGGDPGVAMTHLQTDAAGAGSVSLQGAVEPGATGAWLFISRPSQFSQKPAEFYTTDFVADI